MDQPPPKPASKGLNLFMPGCARLEDHYQPTEIRTDIRPPALPQGMCPPRISVVVPSLNQGRYIVQTLQSLVAQDYPDLEIIVIDGGSTDNTRDIIHAYREHIAYQVSEPDNGQAEAINKGMARATGDLLAWLNSDDCLMPGALFHVARHFLTHPGTDVIYGHRVLINETGQDVGRWILPGHRRFILTYADFIPQETMFWRRAIWDRVGGGLDESFRFAMDWDLICRFLDVNATFHLLPAFLGQFRMHDMQKTKAAIESDGFGEMQIIRRRFQQAWSRHPALQNQYYRLQRASLYSFLVRARLAETLWKYKIKNID